MQSFSNLYDQLLMFSEDYLNGTLQALVVFVLLFFVDLVLTKILRNYILPSLKLNHFFAKVTGREKPLFDIEKAIARVFFFTVLLMIISLCAQMSNIVVLADLTESLFSWFVDLAGLVIRAVTPVALALIFSYLARQGTLWVGNQAKLDDRLGSQLDAGEAVSFSLTKTLSEAAYAVVFFYFLPDIFEGIGLSKMSQPITKMFEDVVAVFPRLILAGVIIFLGWFVARFLRHTLETLMVSFKLDSLLQKVFGENIIGNLKLSKVIPTGLYAVILTLVSVEAMKKLQLETLTAPLQKLIDGALVGLPKLLFAIGIVALAVYIAGLVSKFVSGVLKDMGFDNIYTKLGLSADIGRDVKTPSEIVGFIVSAAIIVMTLTQSLNTLGLESFSGILEALIAKSGEVIVGVIVFGIGLYIAKTVASWVEQVTAVDYSKFLALIVKVVIIVVSGAMALQQIGIADEIVRIAFTLSMGSVALGAAIAIGLGSKETAGELTKDFISKFKK